MPFIFMFFFFVSLSNLYGLAPYTFTLTSHLILTFVIAFTIFFVMLSLSISIKGKRVFLDFLPQNTSLGLAFLLVPIEVVSVVFKPLPNTLFSIKVRENFYTQKPSTTFTPTLIISDSAVINYRAKGLCHIRWSP